MVSVGFFSEDDVNAEPSTAKTFFGKAPRIDDENGRGNPLRVPQRELHGRGPARGGPCQRDLGDAQRVQQTSVGVGLRRGRSVGRERGTQVTETRHRDHPETAANQRLGELQPLVAPASGAVHHQDRRTLTGHRILDRSATRLRDLAARRAAFDRARAIASIAGRRQP
jgi:hypothetical protein